MNWTLERIRARRAEMDAASREISSKIKVGDQIRLIGGKIVTLEEIKKHDNATTGFYTEDGQRYGIGLNHLHYPIEEN